MDSSKTQRQMISLAATLCLILMHSAPATADDAYEVLQHFHFPTGLLPEGVLSYDLNNTTGKFTAYLQDTCSFSQGKYQLQYKSTIRGYLSKDKISRVHGVSVKFHRVWVNIREIIRWGNAIDFTLGVWKTRLPIGYFEESPRCGRVGLPD